jgi:transporter family-2 protein
VPWWGWTGGLLGALYIAASVVLAPRLGAAVLVASIVAGQLAAALVLDHFGLIGFAQKSVTPVRACGAVLLFIGVYLIQRR